jgi:hypothetical protein
MLRLLKGLIKDFPHPLPARSISVLVKKELGLYPTPGGMEIEWDFHQDRVEVNDLILFCTIKNI